MSRRALVLLAGFALAWVLLEAAVATQLEGQYHVVQVEWWRYGLHLAVLAMVCGWRKPERLWQTGRPGYQLVRSLLMLVMPLSFALAIRLGATPGLIQSLFWVSPLLIVAIAHALLGERVSWKIWVASGLGALAAAAILGAARPASPVALLLPALMALSFSMYVVMTRSLCREDPRANLLYPALGAFLVLTPFMPGVWMTPSLHDAVVMSGVGVGGLIGLLMLNQAASLVPVSAIAPILYLYLVFLIAIGLLNGQHPSRRSVAGAAVIVAIAGFLWIQGRALSVMGDGIWHVQSEDSAQ